LLRRAETDIRVAEARVDRGLERFQGCEDRHRPGDSNAQREQQKKGTARARGAAGARGHLCQARGAGGGGGGGGVVAIPHLLTLIPAQRGRGYMAQPGEHATNGRLCGQRGRQATADRPAGNE